MLHSFRSLLMVSMGCLLLLLVGCKQSMVISDVDYSQPIETVLEPDEQGNVEDVQHGIRFNILPLQYAETGDSSTVNTREVRMIRGKEGFYYITAAGYSNVYVMAPDKHKLTLENKIKVTETGIEKPAFNQRENYIQLLNRETNDIYTLTEQGVREKESENSEQEGQES